MYTIHIWVRCSSRFSEVLSDDSENTELAVEELVSQLLLEFFGTVIVERVAIKFFPSESDIGDNLPETA
jgi:hypothetical protein